MTKFELIQHLVLLDDDSPIYTTMSDDDLAMLHGQLFEPHVQVINDMRPPFAIIRPAVEIN